MGGVLTGIANFLTPALQVHGAYKQQADIEADQAKRKQGTEAGIDAMLSTLGPEYEWARQARKSGMPADEIIHTIGGPIGKQLQDTYQQHKMQELFANPDDFKNPAKIQQAAIAGVIPWGDAMKMLQPTGFKPGAKLATFLSEKGVTPPQWDAMPEEAKKPLIAEFDKVAGGEATTLKPIYNPKDGTVNWTYEPKSGPAGTSVGQQQPRMGATAQADEASTRDGLKELGSTIDTMKMGNSSMPTWGTYAKMKAGLSVDPSDLQMLGQISVLNATMIGLVSRSWGSRNVGAAQEIINLHVPKVGDSPKLIKQKIQEWLRPGGYLDQYRKMSGEIPPGQALPGYATEPEAPDDLREY